MEDLKELIITGLILFVYFVFVGKKKKPKQKPVPPPIFGNENEETMTEIKEVFSTEKETSLEEFSQNLPKNEEYFTYETLESSENKKFESVNSYKKSTVEKEVQSVENEGENKIELSFTQDELIKGVIYAEILKNPNN